MSDLDAQSRTDDNAPSPSAGDGGADTGSWPRIADYWPDAPRRAGPGAGRNPGWENPAAPSPAAPGPGGPAGPGDPAATRLISPPPKPGRSWLRIFLSALGALVFLGGSVMVLARLVSQSGDTDSSVSAPGARQTAGQDAGGQDLGGLAVPASPPVSIEPRPSATASPAGSGSPSPSAKPAVLPFTAGTFELTGDVVDLNVTMASLGNDAIQFNAPSGSGLRPRATVAGNTLKLAPNPGRGKGSGRLDVRLNTRIAWSLKLSGGVTTGSFDLFRATLRRIDLPGGAAKLDMRLPSPAGGVPIRMSGGVNTWEITTAQKVPIRVRLRDGGGVATLNGHRTTGIDRGTLLRDDTGDGGPLVIDAVAGLGTLIVGPVDD